MDTSEILLEQARQQLARQEAAIDTLRKQAVAVFSASGIAASLFVSKLSDANRLAVAVAGFLFLLGTFAMIHVMRPRSMHFGEKLEKWFPWYDEAVGSTNPDVVLMRNLAERLDTNREGNAEPFDKIASAYLALCVLFGLQVATWVTAGLIH